MNEQVAVMAVAMGTVFLLVLGMLVLVAKFYRRVKTSEALVVTTPGGARVFRSGGLVYPIINTAEVVDLTAKTIAVVRAGRDAAVTKDDTRVDVEATLSLRVNDTTEDILKAAREIGAARIADPKALTDFFGGRFERAVADAIRLFPFEEIADDRTRVEDQVTVLAREDLHGFVLDRVVIDRVEPTPADGAGPFR